MTAPSGLVIVDKPSGMTSHDVVARVRRLAGTRRVGHAGTLDPMATGVLVVGVEKATRLLGYLTLTEKTYVATIRLGQSTSTDDAEGEPTGGSPATDIAPGALDAEIAELTGDIWQVPPGVSAIKVNGQRAYKLTRAGVAPELAARPVTVYEFTVTGLRETGDFLDIDAVIRCSSGTYIRALARDLGTALGTGGHLTALRRTAVGPYNLDQAHTLQDLETQKHQTRDPERTGVTPAPQSATAAPAAEAAPQESAIAAPAADPAPRESAIAAPAADPAPRESAIGAPAADPASQESATATASAKAASRDSASVASSAQAIIVDSAIAAPSAEPPSSQSAKAAPSAEAPGQESAIAASSAEAAGQVARPVAWITPLAEAAAEAFPRLDLTADEARRLAQGARLPLPPNPPHPPAEPSPIAYTPLADAKTWPSPGTPIAAFAPDDTLVALVTADSGCLRSLAVFIS
jgi:tRNA pseudouridine55 synthase